MSEFKSWKSYRDFANRIRRENRFIRTTEDEDFLLEVLRTSESRHRELPKDFGLWRAQLGHSWRDFYEHDRYVGEIPCAYPPERMKPLEGQATEGRANPKGIPVLYLSTTQQTAMTEVRPWLGSLISCAHFKTTRLLKIVDFSVYHDTRSAFYFSELDSSEREKEIWTQIDQAFSKPLTASDDTAGYAPTQMIAELFKNNGCDGIAYKSAFGDDGFNIALFDPSDAELTYCCLHEAKTLAFSFEQADNPYWIKADRSGKKISTGVTKPAQPPGDTDD